MISRTIGLLGLSLVPILSGCAPASPAFQLKLDEAGTTRVRGYTTAVVRTFANDSGEAVPPDVLQDLQKGVIAQLEQCYPQAFQKVTREATGAAEELVVSGTIIQYDEGNRFARAMIAGLGSATLVVEVSLADASGSELIRSEGRWVFAMGGIIGATFGMGSLVDMAGSQIGDEIARARGLTPVPCPSDPRSVK